MMKNKRVKDMNIFEMRDELSRLKCVVQNVVGSEGDVYALPMFMTLEDQTDYVIPKLLGAILVSVIIESNPLDVAGDTPEATITGTTLKIPAQPFGLRVYVVYKKK